MTTGWYVAIAIVIIAAVAVLSFRAHGSRVGRPAAWPPADGALMPTVAEAREAARLAHMSADDRAWETASLQRHQARQAGADPMTDMSRSD
jgi:hypothetical protein